jgi:hypothetical protein
VAALWSRSCARSRSAEQDARTELASRAAPWSTSATAQRCGRGDHGGGRAAAQAFEHDPRGETSELGDRRDVPGIYDRLRLGDPSFAASFWSVRTAWRTWRKERGVRAEDVAIPVELFRYYARVRSRIELVLLRGELTCERSRTRRVNHPTSATPAAFALARAHAVALAERAAHSGCPGALAGC